MVQTFNPKEIFTPVSAYSHAVLVPAGSDIILTSGAIGIDKDGNVPPEFDAQCRLVWSNIAHILADAGCSLGDIVRINAFLKRRQDAAAFRDIRDEMVPQKPAATVIISELIDPSWLIEVEVTAARAKFDEGSR